VRFSGKRRARDKSKGPYSQSDVPETQRQIDQSLDYPDAVAGEAIKTPAPNQTLIAFVRALGRKAAREWLKKQSDGPA